MVKNCLGLVLVVTLLGIEVFAQRIPVPFLAKDKWEFSGFIGFGGAGDDTFVTPVEEGTTKNVKLDIDQGYALGIRITENRGRFFGAELEYSVTNHPLSFQQLSTALPSITLDHRMHKLAYSFLLYGLGQEKIIRPFGSVGLGTSFFHVSSDSRDKALMQGADLKNRWKLAVSYGGGVKVKLTPGWGLRVDFRNQITGVPDFGFPSQAPLLALGGTGLGFRPDGVLYSWQTIIGFIYAFR
ncbi:MAG: hypothetical protein VYA53_09350 [Acidobacteriota bacterium]|nr:hypothetical protein [Acidobacteriota bacterium]